MKRRTFLQTFAAVPLGLLGLRKSESAQQCYGGLDLSNSMDMTAFRPPPRWEWEVGEWEDDRREWRAEVDVTEGEFRELWISINGMNEAAFCGMGIGRLRVHGCKFERIPHGLVRASIELMEYSFRRDRQYYTTAEEPFDIRTWQVYELIDFCKLFRGGNVVVSVSGKESDNVEPM